MLVTSEVLRLFYNDPKKLLKSFSNWQVRNNTESLLANMALDLESTYKNFILEIPAPGDREVTKFIVDYVNSLNCEYYVCNGITDKELLELKKDIYGKGNFKKSFKDLLKASENHKNYEEFLISKYNRKCVNYSTLCDVKDYIRDFQSSAEFTGILKSKRSTEVNEKPNRDFNFEKYLNNFEGVPIKYEGENKLLYLLNFVTFENAFLKRNVAAPVDFLLIGAKSIHIINFKILNFSQREIPQKFEEEYWLDICILNLLIEFIKKNKEFADNKHDIRFIVIDNKGYQSVVTISPECAQRCEKTMKTFINNYSELFRYGAFNSYPNVSKRITI